MKLGLGTAQFGMNYGITNTKGKCSEAEVAKILSLAQKNNIDTIDTATAYGDSESVLGRCLPKNHEFKIITKIPLFQKNIEKFCVTSWFESTLKRLQQDKVYAVLFHDAEDMLGEHAADQMNELIRLKTIGAIKKIGVSVYDPEQLKKIMAKFSIDIIQAPLNLVDQRFIQNNHLIEIANKQIEVHIRSVFLQGLLISSSMVLPNSLKSLSEKIYLFHQECKARSISPLVAALSFLKNRREIDRLIVGCSSFSEFEEILGAYNKIDDDEFDFSKYCLNDPMLIDPRFWGKEAV